MQSDPLAEQASRLPHRESLRPLAQSDLQQREAPPPCTQKVSKARNRNWVGVNKVRRQHPWKPAIRAPRKELLRRLDEPSRSGLVIVGPLSNDCAVVHLRQPAISSWGRPGATWRRLPPIEEDHARASYFQETPQ